MRATVEMDESRGGFMPEWNPVFLLPNLRIKHAVMAPEAAIVPPDDERVRAYSQQYPQFGQFLSKFTDPFGVRNAPGVLLLNETARPTFRSMEAVSSFRDLVALSVIPLHRAKSMVHDRSFHIQYSDYFDFYPWSFNDQNGHIVCSTPSLIALHEVRAFKGQSSPILSALDFDIRDLDEPLLTALLARWRIRYDTKNPEWPEVALFRSLNMAVAASKMPAGADVTQFALGRSLGLWVSAFEILTHKGNENVRLWDVYDKIAALPWREKKMKFKRYTPKTSKVRRNLACWIYGEIHGARNNFLHGNPVDAKSLTVKQSKRNLFSYPAPLYRMALTGFLQLPEPSSMTGAEWSRKRYDLIMNQYEIEEALSTVIISDKAYRAERTARMSKVRMTSRRPATAI
jgi:hypothetical protein